MTIKTIKYFSYTGWFLDLFIYFNRRFLWSKGTLFSLTIYIADIVDLGFQTTELLLKTAHISKTLGLSYSVKETDWHNVQIFQMSYLLKRKYELAFSNSFCSKSIICNEPNQWFEMDWVFIFSFSFLIS